MCSSVDLPAPDGPMIDTNSPGAKSSEMRRRTYVVCTPCLYVFSMLRRLMIARPLSASAAGVGAGDTCSTGSSRNGSIVQRRGRGATPPTARCPSSALKLHRFGHVLLDDAAVEEMDAAIGVAGVPRVVRDHRDRRTGAVQLLEQLHDRLAVLRVEISGGLVGQENGGLSGHRPGHGDALLLTAGQLAGKMPRAMRHAHALE